jgi:hypothetical protein
VNSCRATWPGRGGRSGLRRSSARTPLSSSVRYTWHTVAMFAPRAGVRQVGRVAAADRPLSTTARGEMRSVLNLSLDARSRRPARGDASG